MATPGRPEKEIWDQTILPGIERFTLTSLTPSTKRFVRRIYQEGTSLAICASRVVLADAEALAKASEKLPDLPDNVPYSIRYWFPYSALVVHMADTLDRRGIPSLPAWYDNQRIASYTMVSTAIQTYSSELYTFSEWLKTPNLLGEYLNGLTIVETIASSKKEAARGGSGSELDNKLHNSPEVIDRLVQLGAKRYRAVFFDISYLVSQPSENPS